MNDRSLRREFLVGLGALAAGCTTASDDGDDGGSDGSGDPSGTGESPGTPTATLAEDGSADGPTPTPTATTAGDLDLREANVVGVAVEPSDGAYRFDVTLYHDDDGEDGYANWWQVETRGGERLGRRELLHAHGTREFTRSETVEVPDGVGCVVVRGHDQTHGYGGRAMLVSLDGGATRPVDQGPEPDSFEGADCP